MRTRTWDQRSLAWLAVVAWHGFLGGWLLRRPFPASDDALDAPGLRVVYVALPPSKPDTIAARSTARARVVRARDGHARSRRPAPVSETRQADTREAVAPTAPRTLAEEAGAYARTSQRAPLQVDPFADRPVRLPEPDAGRFRMREAITPAGAIAWTAKHVFAPMIPKGYDPDPCPRNRENIASLATEGDSAALAQELAFERRHCRP